MYNKYQEFYSIKLYILFSQHVDHPANSALLQHEALNTADEVEGPKAVRQAKNVDIMVLVEVVTVVTDVF